jgi:hypothetical protein
MVDFGKLLQRHLESLSPEQRAHYDTRMAQEAKWDETKSQIPAVFERLKLMPKHQPLPVRRPGGSVFRAPPMQKQSQSNDMVSKVVETWEKPVTARIIERENYDGTIREIIEFQDAVTGHESYYLDEHFCNSLMNADDKKACPRLYICAGTPGKYNACSLSRDDIANYLRDKRPHLFPDTLPAFSL